MKYITHRRFKNRAICGDIVNIPANTPCYCIGNIITYNNKQICLNTSENGHQYFTNNEDDQGLIRGKLTQAIQKCLAKRDENYQARWDKIWEDVDCQKYKRADHSDFWLWNHEFFQAPIEDLRHIANLIGLKEKNL